MVLALRNMGLRDLPSLGKGLFRGKTWLLPRKISSNSDSDSCDCPVLAEEVRSSIIGKNLIVLKNKLNQ